MNLPLKGVTDCINFSTCSWNIYEPETIGSELTLVLAGCGFLNNCLEVCPKLLMIPIVAVFSTISVIESRS
jgi:hypothetical protein